MAVETGGLGEYSSVENVFKTLQLAVVELPLGFLHCNFLIEVVIHSRDTKFRLDVKECLIMDLPNI